MAKELKVEWVPHVTMDVNVHFPSTWKGARGKLLTSQRITQYALEGRYGTEAKRRAEHDFEQRHGIRECCQCGKKGHFTIKTWDYLPKVGPYCPICLELQRSDRDKEKNARKLLKQRIAEEYV